MMNDNCEIGKELNKNVIKELRNICMTRTSTIVDGKNIGKRVIETVSDCLRPLPSISEKQEMTMKAKRQKDDIEIFLKCRQSFFETDNVKAISDGFNYSLSNQNFSPLYDIKESESHVLIVIDVSGEFTVSTSIDGAFIVFKGKKILSHLKCDKSGELATEWCEYDPKGAIHTQNREYGEFELRIPLPKGYDKVTVHNTKRKKENGTFHVIVYKPEGNKVVDD